MADYTKQDIFDIITEYLEQYGSAVGSYSVHELTAEELTDANLRVLTIPGMRPDNQQWVQTSLRNMLNPIDNAVSDLTTLKTETAAARDAANTAAGNVQDAIDDAEEATTHAENVNATLVGMTVTVTDRNGQSRSVNIGFEIAPEHVYASKALMKADAAHVLAGQFCMIATTDPTDPDNATLWSRNSNSATNPDNCFTFLSDLDQASSSAWADWMNNQKPLIIAATNDANAAALLANAKAALAQTAADNADASRVAIEANEQTRQTNEQNRVAAETQRQNDWTAFFSDTLATGCRYLWSNFWSNINTLWTGFWGTSSEDPNGVRKQWSDLHDDASADHLQAYDDHTQAVSDHSIATTDHNTATADHNTASADHTQAESDTSRAETDHTDATTATANANTQANRAKLWADHPPYIADGTAEHPGDLNYWYIYSEELNRYVKSPYAKGDDLHWDEMSEAEKDALAQKVLDNLIFASVQTGRDIITELL